MNTLWAGNTADDDGFRPLCDDDGKALGFTGWYRRWLDAAEDQASNGIR
ncbi:hypothetical protein [Microtetraspora malaysiensis]